MLAVFKQLRLLLIGNEKKEFVKLMFLIFIMGIMDALGIASIIPFIAVLSNPEVIDTNSVLFWGYNYLNSIYFLNKQQYLVFLGLIAFFIFIFSLFIKSFTTFKIISFTQMCEYILGKKLLKGYLSQPYLWFKANHSAELSKNILSEVTLVTNQVIMPVMHIISQSVIVIFILALIFGVDYKLAIISTITLGSFYLIVHKLSKVFLQNIGIKRLNENEERYKITSEALTNNIELKLKELENIYLEKFSNHTQSFVKYIAQEQMIRFLPRFVLEAIAFGGLLLIILYLMLTYDGFSKALPIIALYAFAGYRLMPSLQLLHASMTQVNFASSTLNKICMDINNFPKKQIIKNHDKVNKKKNKISLNDQLTLNDINFTFNGSTKSALSNINLNIKAGEKIGIIGTTGGGKSLLAHIILGLISPTSGSIYSDGEKINNDNIRDWKQIVGYVPQSIFISEKSIIENIAIGQTNKNINYEKVVEACKLSHLHEFITGLRKGYNTTLGERGNLLSGGQIQRIGIARALYKKPSILILDEATSALDNVTEKSLMSIIHKLKNVTLIIIAHRLSTLKKCDNIYVLEKGCIKDNGTYKDLEKRNESFKAI